MIKKPSIPSAPSLPTNPDPPALAMIPIASGSGRTPRFTGVASAMSRVSFDGATVLPAMLASAAVASTRATRRIELAPLRARYDAQHYGGTAYRHGPAGDVVTYAGMPGETATRMDPQDSSPAGAPATGPTDSERRMMDALGIGFENGVYGVEDYRSHRLSEVVDYANALARLAEDDGGR
jgi:hypothetical protein